jgi:hypothetical protein
MIMRTTSAPANTSAAIVPRCSGGWSDMMRVHTGLGLNNR